MSDRMRIVVCSNFYPPRFVGGAELVAHQYARALASAGHEVVVFAGDTHSLGERHSMWSDAVDGIPVRRVRLSHEDFNPEFVNVSHRAVDDHFGTLLDAVRPHVVHLHNIVGLSAGLIHAARARGARTVVTLHDYWGYCYRNTLLKPGGEVCMDHRRCAECLPTVGRGNGADRRIPIQLRNDFVELELGLADVLVSPSRHLAARYVAAGVPSEAMRVIPYGVPVVRFAGIRREPRPDCVRFGFVGYFGPHKGLRTLLSALPELEPHRGRFEVNLIGDGELVQETRQRIQEMGWKDTVRLLGKVRNDRIEQAYRKIDVLMLPSVWPENHPVSITEAMAAGIPVIASRMGGIPELIEDGVTGLLCDPGDSKALARAMAACIEDHALVEALGARAAEAMRANTVERRVQEYLEIYATGPDAARVARGRPRVVACIGERFPEEGSRVIARLAEGRWSDRPRFVMAEWIDETLLAGAAMLWVVDGSTDPDVVAAAARRGLPVLVPAGSDALQRFCLDGNCGLYYEDEDEAVACIELLLRNEPVRRALGRNAAAHARPRR
jgi:glycosyltransferase involved in cell wall biosynthesis